MVEVALTLLTFAAVAIVVGIGCVLVADLYVWALRRTGRLAPLPSHPEPDEPY